MSVLVIPQNNTSVLFVLNLRLFIIPGVLGLTEYYFPINQVFEGSKKFKTFWLASALVEAGAGKDTGSCQCMKSVQIWSFFWSVFSCIQSEYRKIRTRGNFVFGHFSRCVHVT